MNPSIIEASFNNLLKVYEVRRITGFVTTFTDSGTGVPGSEEQAGFRYRSAGLVVLRGG